MQAINDANKPISKNRNNLNNDLVEILLQNMRQNFLNRMQKNLAENSIPLPKNHKNAENISFAYDVNEHVYSQVKFRLTK